LGSSPFNVSEAENVVNDNKVVHMASEASAISTIAQHAAALRDRYARRETARKRPFLAIKIGVGREINVRDREGELLPATRLEDAEGRDGDRAKG